MKKLTMLSIAMMVMAVVVSVASSPAYAMLDAWTFNAGYGANTNINYLIASGEATVNQSYGVDSIFNNGDIFTESARLDILTYRTEGGATKVLSLGGNMLYAEVTGLTGSVYDVTGAGPGTYDFKYKFDPFVGDINLYVDTDQDSSNGFISLLASLKVVSPSGGEAPAGFLGGAGPDGNTALTALFTSVNPGVFTKGALDFGTLPSGVFAFSMINTNNLVQQAGDVTFTATGFSAKVQSAGQVNVGVTPEPATMLLFGIGAAGLAAFRRKKVA